MKYIRTHHEDLNNDTVMIITVYIYALQSNTFSTPASQHHPTQHSLKSIEASFITLPPNRSSFGLELTRPAFQHGLLGIISMSVLPLGQKNTKGDKHNKQLLFVSCVFFYFGGKTVMLIIPSSPCIPGVYSRLFQQRRVFVADLRKFLPQSI